MKLKFTKYSLIPIIFGSLIWFSIAALTYQSSIYTIDPDELDQGVTGNGRTLYAICNKIGTTKPATIRVVNRGRNTYDKYIFLTTFNGANYTKITLEIENGARFKDSTSNPTFTWGGQVDALPNQQIADWGNGSGALSFGTTPKEVYADWFGDHTYLAVSQAYAAVAEGSIIRLSGGPWAFGTSQLDLITKSVTLKGIGGSIDYDSIVQGTVVSHTGTNSAIRVNNATNVEDLRITGGVYGITLGNDSGSGAVSWGGRLQNVMISGASTAGIHATGIQAGLAENVFSQSNTGAGMLVSGSNNTHGVFTKCRFYNNDQEGVLYTGNSQFRYYGCHFESNDYEGVKNSATALSDTHFDGCWIEANNVAAGHASGYYNLLLSNTNNANINIVNCHFNGATTADNGHVGFQGVLSIQSNYYEGTALTAKYTFLGVNDRLFNKGDYQVTLDSGSVAFAHQNNNYNAAINEILRDSQNVLLGAGHDNIPKLNNVMIINDTGNKTYVMPPCEDVCWFGISALNTYQAYLSPATGDAIIPTCTVGKDIQNSGALGDCLWVRGDATGVYWQETIKIGTWTAEL